MVFVTLGSQKFNFDRLLIMIDNLVEKNIIDENVFAQIGRSGKYTPKFYKYTDFLNGTDFQSNMEIADLVITHAGTGAIISAIKKSKKVIVVPRCKDYNEHVDNHQSEIADAFVYAGYVLKAEKEEELAECVRKSADWTPKPYVSNTDHFIEVIRKAIDD